MVLFLISEQRLNDANTKIAMLHDLKASYMSTISHMNFRQRLHGLYVLPYNARTTPQLGDVNSIEIASTDETNLSLLVCVGRRKVSESTLPLLQSSSLQWNITSPEGDLVTVVLEAEGRWLTISTNLLPSMKFYSVSDTRHFGGLMQGLYRSSRNVDAGQLSVEYDFETDQVTVVMKTTGSGNNHGTQVAAGQVLVDRLPWVVAKSNQLDSSLNYVIPYRNGWNTVSTGTLTWRPHNSTIHMSHPSGLCTLFSLNLDAHLT
jgi:hypothetical protein